MTKYQCPTCGEKAGMRFQGVQFDENGDPMCSLWNCGECRSTVSGAGFYPGETVILEKSDDPFIAERHKWGHLDRLTVSLLPTEPLTFPDLQIRVNGVAVMAFSVRPREYKAHTGRLIHSELEVITRTRSKRWACQGWTFSPSGESYYIKTSSLASVIRYVQSLGLSTMPVTELARLRGWPEELIQEGMEDE